MSIVAQLEVYNSITMMLGAVSSRQGISEKTDKQKVLIYMMSEAKRPTSGMGISKS